jgi:hypothetical protein
MDTLHVKRFMLGHLMGILLVLGVALGGIAALAARGDVLRADTAPAGIANVAAATPTFDGNVARLEALQIREDAVAAGQLEERRAFFARKLDDALR